MPNLCQGCTACCEVMLVRDDDWVKPHNTKCEHQCKTGCKIYNQRPDACQGFECLWLISQQLTNRDRMEKALRPDRCHVVLEVNPQSTVIAHCKYPKAWKREPIYSNLLYFAAKTPVLIEEHGTATPFLLRSDGSTEPMVHIGQDEFGYKKYQLETDPL